MENNESESTSSLKSQGRSSSVTMQAYNQTPPTELRLLEAHQTSFNGLLISKGQNPYDIKQQMMSNQQNNQQLYLLWYSQSFPQPVSNSSNLQLRQLPQMRLNNSMFEQESNRNQRIEIKQTHSASTVATSPPTGQFASLPAAQQGAPTQNFNHHSSHQTSSRNTVPQQNLNMAPMTSASNTVSWFPPNSAGNLPDINLNGQHNRMHFSQPTAAQPLQADLSGQSQAQQIIRYNQSQTCGGHTNAASYSTAGQYPATSPLVLSQPVTYSHQTSQSDSSYDGNQVQHSSQIPHQPTAAQPLQADLSGQSQAQQIIRYSQGQTCGGHTNAASYSTAGQYPATSPLVLSQPVPYSHQTSQSVSSFDGNQVQHSSQIPHQPTAAQPLQADLSGQSQAQQIIRYNQGQTCGGHTNAASYSTAGQYPATSPLVLSQPVPYSHQTSQSDSSFDGNQVQHSSQIPHQPTPYRMENNSASYCHLTPSRTRQSLTSNKPSPKSYVGPHSMINQSAVTGLSQDNVQLQNSLQQRKMMQVSGQHSRASQPTVPPFQGNTLSQVLQLNHTTSGLPPVTSNAPTLVLKESTLHYASNTLKNLLKDGMQGHSQGHGTSPSSCHMANFTTQGQHSPNSTKESYSETSGSATHCSASANLCGTDVQRLNGYQAPVQRTAISKEDVHVNGHVKALYVQSSEGVQSQRLRTDRNTERENDHKHSPGPALMQYHEVVSQTRELIKELQKGNQQSHKVVAVVPPISQQVGRSNESNALNLHETTIQKLQQFLSVPCPERREGEKHNESTVDSLISDAQITDIPQPKTGLTTPDRDCCSTVHNDHETGQLNCDVVDLSKVQVHNFTLKKFRDWAETLENKQITSVPAADVLKCLMELYWDGNPSNIKKQVPVLQADMVGLFANLSIEEVLTAKFQYIASKDLENLACSNHILKNDTILPTEEFKSLWLNVDGKPADIDGVLAEPILDLSFPDHALETSFNNLPPNINSEYELPIKVIPAETDDQNDQIIIKQLASSLVCQSKSSQPNQTNAQEPSEKLEDEKVEETHEQNGHFNSKESEGSNENVDTMAEKRITECEQACSDATEEISSACEINEQADLLNKDDSSNDSELLMELSLLSASDARRIFEELSDCSLKNNASPVCWDKTKISAILDLGESYDLCNQIKFTCPHVTDMDCTGEHFCHRCWGETPLLHLELEEAPFSPKEGPPTPTQGHRDQSCSPLSGGIHSNCIDLSKGNSITASPNSMSDVSDVTVLELDLNPGDVVERYTSPSLVSKSPVKEPHEQVSETNGSMGVASAKSLFDAQSVDLFMSVKTQNNDFYPPENLHKKLRQSKSTVIPVEHVQDPFSADMVNKNASSKNPNPSNFTVTPAVDDLNGKEVIKEREDARTFFINQNSQINAPQADNQDTYSKVYSGTRSESSTPDFGVYMSNVKPDCKLGDSVQGSSSLFGISPDKEAHRPVHSGRAKFGMPINEQVGVAEGLPVAELLEALSFMQTNEKGKPVVPSQTTELRLKNSLPSQPPCKKVRVTKTIRASTADDLFTPDIIVKNASSPKSNPGDLKVSPTKDPDRKDKKKEMEEKKSSNVLIIQRNSHSGQSKTDAPTTTSFVRKKREFGYTKQTGPNKEIKKQKFALYGSNNGNRNRTGPTERYSISKLHTAPLYITVLDQSETSYTGTVSAKEKVYSKWSSTFVATKASKLSSKKRLKNVNEVLESRVQGLKRLVKERPTLKEKQLRDGKKNKRRA